MSTTIEMEGNTVEDAIKAALDKLGVEREDAIIEVLEEEKGFFRIIGGSKARVRVSIIDNGIDKVVNLIKSIMERIKINGNIEVVEEGDNVTINITGPQLGILIGKQGETLSAIQTIANVIIKKANSTKKVIIDIEGYRNRHIENIAEIAIQAAEKAIRTKRAVALKPMNSFDRRAVHIALQNNEKIYTTSEGEEPERRVIITPR